MLRYAHEHGCRWDEETARVLFEEDISRCCGMRASTAAQDRAPRARRARCGAELAARALVELLRLCAAPAAAVPPTPAVDTLLAAAPPR